MSSPTTTLVRTTATRTRSGGLVGFSEALAGFGMTCHGEHTTSAGAQKVGKSLKGSCILRPAGPDARLATSAAGPLILPKMHRHVTLNNRLLEATKARLPAVSASTLYGRGVYTTVAV